MKNFRNMNDHVCVTLEDRILTIGGLQDMQYGTNIYSFKDYAWSKQRNDKLLTVSVSEISKKYVNLDNWPTIGDLDGRWCYFFRQRLVIVRNEFKSNLLSFQPIFCGKNSLGRWQSYQERKRLQQYSCSLRPNPFSDWLRDLPISTLLLNNFAFDIIHDFIWMNMNWEFAY